MRNKIIDDVISEIVDNANVSHEFKVAFKQYIRNRFDGNVTDSDLKTVLNMIDSPEDIIHENDDSFNRVLEYPQIQIPLG